MARPLLIVGAGFSGAVLARQLAEAGERRIVVIDARLHLAGNCHTERDEATGVMMHRYGPHTFHTDREEVWRYLDRFAELQPFTNRIRASIARGVFSLPINLGTINQFFGKRFRPEEARRFLESQADRSIGEPANFEEQALKFLGRELYDAFFYGYTRKQWGVEPRELPASILKRLPVRFDYHDSYYRDPFQGIPRHGYTEAVRRMLEHPAISVQLGAKWEPGAAGEFAHVFYTGPLDEYFGHRFGRLRYRTVFWERIEEAGDFQGNAIINYPGLEEPQTRIFESKHFAPWEKHERTVASVEFSKATDAGDDPFYPLRLAEDRQLFARYAREAVAVRGVSFLGRLATYRYLDMQHVIAEALEFSTAWLRARAEEKPLPVFPFDPFAGED